jgi:hypothetical protein
LAGTRASRADKALCATDASGHNRTVPASFPQLSLVA